MLRVELARLLRLSIPIIFAQLSQMGMGVRRRTRVARLFPNEASCLRLVSAVLMEIAEDWQTADKRGV